MIKPISLGLVAALSLCVANAAALEPIGDNMARKFDVQWHKDGFTYTLRNTPILHLTSNATLNLNGVRVRAYTQPPLNQPLNFFGGIYDGKDFLQGVSGIGVLFGIANSCQGFNGHQLTETMGSFVDNMQKQGSYTLNKTINGAQYKLIGIKKGAGLYHLDFSMRYPAGLQPKCAFSKYPAPPIPSPGDLKSLPATGKVDGPRKATPAEAQEARRYARRLTGRDCTGPITIRQYIFNVPLSAQQRRVVVQDGYKEIAQTFKDEGKTYDIHYDYNTFEAWGVTTEKSKNIFTLLHTSASGKNSQLLCQLAD